MTKKHFIALADAIREHSEKEGAVKFSPKQIETLADFCASENPNFNRGRWLDYIDGKCGPSEGKVK